MPDVYNGQYQAFLAEYAVDDARDSETIMTSTLTRFPITQVPAVFVYMGSDGMIRTVHHLHHVEVPFGQANQWAGTVLGFSGDVHQNQIVYLSINIAEFFANTEVTQVPTVETLGAVIATLADGAPYVGPFAADAADTEECRSRRAVPVPHAYVPQLFGRTLTPREAWEQIGAQVILDQREADCQTFLNFFRMACTYRRPRPGQRGPQPPSLLQPQPLTQPLGDQTLLEHIGRRLKQLLPVTMAPAAALGPQFAQATNALRQALQEDRELDRADRAVAAEADGVQTSFSVVFPAVAAGIRRLCGAGDDDELLPNFWKLLALAKGKKAQAMSVFTQLITARANQPDSSQILPVVTTQLFNQIIHFELGSADLSVITNGVSPFLMCPLGYSKAATEQTLSQQYLMIHNESGSTPSLADVQRLLTPTYNLPESLHQLVDFIGAYSIVWDVLVGPDNPIAVAIRLHYQYWHRTASYIKADLPQPQLQGHVIMGTLRAMQLEILGYVNKRLYTDAPLPPPSLSHIEQTIQRGVYTLPALPEKYWSAPTTAGGPATSGTPLGPPGAPGETKLTSGNPQIAPDDHRIAAWHDAFNNSDKSVQQLKALPNAKRPKATKGGFLCLAYHLRGQCFDNCRFKASHRKLTEAEQKGVQRLLDTEL